MWVNRYYGKTNQIKSFFPTLLSSAYILNINFGENTVICRVTKSRSCRTHHTSFTTTVPTVTQQTSFNQSARAGAVSSSSGQIRPASLGSQTRSYLHKTPIGVHGHSQPGIPQFSDKVLSVQDYHRGTRPQSVQPVLGFHSVLVFLNFQKTLTILRIRGQLVMVKTLQCAFSSGFWVERGGSQRQKVMFIICQCYCGGHKTKKNHSRKHRGKLYLTYQYQSTGQSSHPRSQEPESKCLHQCNSVLLLLIPSGPPGYGVVPHIQGTSCFLTLL